MWWAPEIEGPNGPSMQEVTVDVEDPEWIGVLLGPSGEVLMVVFEQRHPFGFQPR